MVQALEVHARAIIAYIRRDFSLGLQLSRRAHALTEGANAGLRKLTSSAVDVGRALVDGDPDVVRQLEAHKPRPGTQLHTPFVYWVLSEVYAARGDLAASSIWLARCETRLPHARGLLNKASDASVSGAYLLNLNPYSTPASAPHLYTVHRRDRLQATLVVVIGWLFFILVCALWFARVR